MNMKKKLRVNSISRESISGRVSTREFEGIGHIVVSGVGHIVCDSVMNGILYSKEVVETMAKALSNANAYINAPIGHPSIGGVQVSASHPLAIQIHGAGAFCYNFRMEGDRLISDLAINQSVAQKTDLGKEIIDRINSGKDIDMSTGLYGIVSNGNGHGSDGEQYDSIMEWMELDHCALLPHQTGAATSNEGVGVFVNAAASRDGEKCDLSVSKISNASSAGLSFDVVDGKYDEASAVARIKKFTCSAYQMRK